MNLCIFVGNFTKDPVVKKVNGANGEVSVVKFVIGVNRKFKGKEKSTFPTIEAWGDQADLIGKYFKKGSLIRVFTHLETDKFEDKETGKERSLDKYVLERFEFPESNSKAGKPADEEDEGDFAPDEEVEPAAPQAKVKNKGKGRGKEVATVGVSEDDDGLGIPF
jgi:single-strand DNA-binding protein